MTYPMMSPALKFTHFCLWRKIYVTMPKIRQNKCYRCFLYAFKKQRQFLELGMSRENLKKHVYLRNCKNVRSEEWERTSWTYNRKYISFYTLINLIDWQWLSRESCQEWFYGQVLAQQEKVWLLISDVCQR